MKFGRAVREALAEDIGSGDVTTLATVPEQAVVTALMVARELLVAGRPGAGRSRVCPNCARRPTSSAPPRTATACRREARF